MITKLNITNKKTAKNILHVQIPAYKVEAEIMSFYGIPQLKDTVETIMNCRETFLGYYAEGELAACLSYTETQNDIHICRLVVHPDHFRKGIAKKLVQHIIDLANNKKIFLSTGSKNVPAKNLYKLFGFVEIKDVEVAPTIFITLFEKD
jgi:ribosomal protein S18 acetylase RimI-like enzyme